MDVGFEPVSTRLVRAAREATYVMLTVAQAEEPEGPPLQTACLLPAGGRAGHACAPISASAPPV